MANTISGCPVTALPLTEYQREHKLLRQYIESQTWKDSKLSLPPPPVTATPD